MVDAVLTPRAPRSATQGVADSRSDGFGLSENLEGVEIVYTRELSEPGLLDFDQIPPFNLLTAVLPNPPGEALETVLRFLRVRRPVMFVLVGRESLGDQFREKAKRLGYTTSLDADIGGGFVTTTGASADESLRFSVAGPLRCKVIPR
jgi:hypothetical protein